MSLSNDPLEEEGSALRVLYKGFLNYSSTSLRKEDYERLRRFLQRKLGILLYESVPFSQAFSNEWFQVSEAKSWTYTN